jgi:hypothetical protein
MREGIDIEVSAADRERLAVIEAVVPAGKLIHAILDNCAVHKQRPPAQWHGTPNERVVWPWPVRSSARTTSPGPKRRVVPSPIPISLPHENKNVLSPGRGMPIAPVVRRETAEHEVGTRLKRNVVAHLGWQREILKMGLAVVARIYPYDHARAPFPLESFWGPLWHQWVASERRRPLGGARADKIALDVGQAAENVTAHVGYLR